MISFFKKKTPEKQPEPVLVDLHSHLLPGLDDGVDTMEEAIDIILRFEDLGYKKIITTPHIMSDFFNNSEEKIQNGLEELKKELSSRNISIPVEAAAEYYLDEQLYERIDNPDDEFLTFGGKYMLFETSFMNEPFYLNDFIFKLKSRGITPVLAHPERYAYIQASHGRIEDLMNRGVLLQVNINSLEGYYSKEVKKLAEKLIDNKTIHFIGSDCHNHKHLEATVKAREKKHFKKALTLPLLNNSLL